MGCEEAIRPLFTNFQSGELYFKRLPFFCLLLVRSATIADMNCCLAFLHLAKSDLVLHSSCFAQHDIAPGDSASATVYSCDFLSHH